MNENFKIAVVWLYGLHEAVFAEVDNMSCGCLDCEHFSHAKFEKNNFRNVSWGKCNKHIDESRQLLDISEKLQFEMEEMLNIYVDGLYRYLPDGRLCTARNPVWRDHLLALCEENSGIIDK